MQSLMLLCIILSTLSIVYVGKCMSHTLAPALYVFGDSLIDSGNNNFLLTVAKSNYAPYGIDFPGSVATGRVTNGRTVPDLIAEHLGLPYPTRATQRRQEPSLTGYTYASAGCGILPQTGRLLNCLSMNRQVSMFEETKEKVLIPLLGDGTHELEYHLANSIFFVWLGNNDYLLNYFRANSDSSKQYTPEQFADLLALRLSEKIQVLHSLGARKIVVFEAPPLGCIPVYLNNNNGECIQSHNDNAALFNAKLKQMIQRLSSELSDAYFTLGKAYRLTYDAISNPASYGLTNVTGTCCLLASLPIIGDMIPCKRRSTPCSNRSEYLFWDAAHPTEAGHSFMSQNCITNPSFCSPFSIQDLVRLSINPSSLHDII